MFGMPAKKVRSNRKRSRPIEPKKMNSRAKYIAVAVLVIVVIIASVLILLYANSGNNQTQTEVNPVAVFDTSMGEFKVELFEDKVPKTCENFEKLVNDGFYDGMIFYRIDEGFMIQAGRYFADGSEDFSPYGNIEFETNPDVRHVDGAISMASTGAGVGGSAEFFICDGPQSFLDDNYAAFGVVVEGMDIVREIASQPHDDSSPAGGGKPYTDIVINSITIE
jgi:cyclophilin family peptidyl-prolyl cis-trans isomerase